MVQRACVFLAAVFLLSAANVQATVIDSFNAADQTLMVTRSNPDMSEQMPVGSAIGGFRDISLHRVSSQPIFVNVFSDSQDSGLFFSQGTGEAETTVTWDGANSPNLRSYLLNAPLTSEGENRFLLHVADVTGTGINVTMTVYTNDDTHYSATDSVWVTAADVISLPYTSFTHNGPDGAANFADVDAIVLRLSGTGHVGSDVAITKLETAAPEPSTLVLAVIGVVVSLCVGRRWRRA
jgi:hypothetical protein